MRLLLPTAFSLLTALSASSPLQAVDTLSVATTDPLLERWRWTTIDRTNGLKSAVFDIEEDRNGVVWFGTMRGLQSCDGYDWNDYTSDSLRTVIDILEERDGVMWFGMWLDGLARYDGTDWRNYTTDDGTATNQVWTLEQTRDGAIWAGFHNENGTFADTTRTLGGISRFDGERWTTVDIPIGPPRPNVVDILEASDGSLWFTTIGHGVFRRSRDTWTQFTKETGLLSDMATRMIEAPDRSIWIGGDKGISRFNPGIVSGGAGTSGQTGQGRWTTYAERDGLPAGARVPKLWSDREGTVWAGTAEPSRLCRFDGEQWHTYPQDAIPHFDGDAVFFGPTATKVGWYWSWFDRKVYRFDPSENWTTYVGPDSLRGARETEDGSVWFSSPRRAVNFHNGRWLSYGPEDGFLDEDEPRIYQTSDGTLWFTGMHRGEGAIARLLPPAGGSRPAWQIFTTADGALDDNGSPFETRSGHVWFVGSRNGQSSAAYYDGRELRRFGIADGLVGESLQSGFEASDGTLWFGTERPSEGTNTVHADGVIRYDPSAPAGPTAWRNYTIDDGLADGPVRDFAEWPEGTLWVATTVGVSRTNLADPDAGWQNALDFGVVMPKFDNFLRTAEALWFRFQPNRQAGVVRYDGQTWEVLTEPDGLASAAVCQIFKASDGALWFPAQGGLSRFDGSRWVRYTERYAPVAGPVQTYVNIQEMSDGSFWLTSRSQGPSVSRELLHFRYGGGAAPKTILGKSANLVSSAGNVSLQWSGTDHWFATPTQDMWYQWRLDDRDWISTNQTDYTFTELAHGDHRFQVRAVNRHGTVDPSPPSTPSSSKPRGGATPS